MARVPLTAQDPARIGDYWLAARLGSGGQADVYEGYDEAGNRVAVKVLRAGGSFGRPARREVEAVRRVASFCTAAVLACDLHADRPYIVSEYVDGPTLRAVVDRLGPLAGDDLHRLAIGTATAVAAVHDAGVVHRDLKPDNVLLSRGGPRVIDFGVARILASASSVSYDLAGTPQYMPPEVFGGVRAGPEADVYAWGAVVLFAATGRPPFTGDDAAAVIYRALHAEPDLAALPPGLRSLVAAALAKDPGQRPAARDLLLRLIAPNESARDDLLALGGERARALRAPWYMAGSPALEDVAEAAFGELPAAEQEHVPGTLLRMVGGDGRTPRPVEPGDLPHPVSSALDPFLDAGLVVEGDDGSLTLGTAALIPAWPRLRGWVREEGEGLAVFERLRSAAVFWRDQGRHDGDLPGGSLFEQVTRWAAAGRTRIGLNELERRFLDAALRSAARRERRRRMLVTALAAMVAVLLTAAAGLVSLNVTANAERERATAQRDLALGRQLMAQSESLAVASPQTARLLAVAASRIAPSSPETRAAIRAAATRHQLAVLRGFPYEVYAVAFSPDGSAVAASGHEDVLRVWDTRSLTPEIWPVEEGEASGTAVAFSPDGKGLAVADAWGRVHLWDTATRTRRTGGEHRSPWARAWEAFSPDGKLLATTRGFLDQSQLWDTASVRPVAVLRSLTGSPGPVAFSPDGRLLAAAYPGGPIRIFDAASGQLAGDPLQPAEGGVKPVIRQVAALAFSPDGRLLAGTTGSEMIQLWDVATRKTVGDPLTGHTDLVTAAAFSPDGRMLATASQDRTVRLWDASTGDPVGEPLTGHTHVVNAVAFSPDGATLASAGADTTVRLWRTPRGWAQPLTLPGEDGGGLVPADRPIIPRWDQRPDTSLTVLSSDGARLVVQPYDGSAAGYGSVWSWDVRAARRRGERLEIRRGTLVDGLAVSRDGRRLAASGFGDADRGRNATIPGGPSSIRGRPLAFSPDGRFLATATSGTAVQVWTLPEGRARGEPLTGDSGVLTAAAFSADGSLLAVGSDGGSVLVWDVTSGERRAHLRGHTLGITSLAFGPAGSLLLSGSDDQSARLWDAASGRPHGVPLTGHTGQVHAVAFSPDGSFLATGSLDRTVRLWDTVTGKGLGPPLAGHRGAVRALAFTPDGKTLVAAAADRIEVQGDSYAVWRWDTASLAADPAATACAQAGRSLTREEWATFLPDVPYREICRS